MCHTVDRETACISIHALLAESDFGEINTRGSEKIFLSTLSLRRATPAASAAPSVLPNFYPRSPCGERLPARRGGCSRLCISIHALLAESDPCACRCRTFRVISIHALLAESDGGSFPSLGSSPRISIHALLAESDEELEPGGSYDQAFLSTLSLRRATSGGRQLRRGLQISIHALLAESDSRRCRMPVSS